MLASIHIPLGYFGDTAFTAFGVGTTWGEVAAFITGAWCVWLVARQNVWNWPVGNINSAFFLALFANYGLYADANLQILYLVLGFYGWWAWLRGGERKTQLPLTRTSPQQWIALGGATILCTAVLGVLLNRYTDSTVPLADAFTTALSLAATWGQARKKLESWWIWITADLIYIPLYVYKDLWLTSILYIVFLSLCIVGLVQWRRQIDREEAPLLAVGQAATAGSI